MGETRRQPPFAVSVQPGSVRNRRGRDWPPASATRAAAARHGQTRPLRCRSQRTPGQPGGMPSAEFSGICPRPTVCRSRSPLNGYSPGFPWVAPAGVIWPRPSIATHVRRGGCTSRAISSGPSRAGRRSVRCLDRRDCSACPRPDSPIKAVIEAGAALVVGNIERAKQSAYRGADFFGNGK